MSDTIRVITYGSINTATTDNKEGAKSINSRFSTEKSSKSSDKKIREYEVAVDTLEAEMGNLINVFERLLTRAEKQTQTEIKLDEIELSVEVNGEGKVSLFGSGGKAGAKGAIKLKFKRQLQN